MPPPTTLAALPSGGPDERRLFAVSIAASVLLHGSLWLGAGWWRLTAPAPAAPQIEIDLTSPPGTGPAHLAGPKKSSPLAVPQKVEPPPEEVKQPPVVPPKTAPPPTDWVTPGPETKKVEAQAPPLPTPGGTPDGTGTASKLGGSGVGANDGVPGGTGDGGTGGTVDVKPKLLNLDEVLANIRRFYPEAERRAGHEAKVKVYLHIGTDGRVGAVDFVQSGGPAFDDAVKQVAHLMRFSPALLKDTPVAVKIGQTMQFKLQD